MKKILNILLIGLALTIGSSASNRGDVKIIEATENIRYLGQKISKSYLYLYQNPKKTALKESLYQDIRMLETAIRDIATTTKSLKKLSVSKKRTKSKFTHLTTAYITNSNQPIKEVDKYLETYITHTGASFKRYNKEEIYTLDSTKLPDILFIDHLYFKTEEQILKIIELGTKVILTKYSRNREV